MSLAPLPSESPFVDLWLGNYRYAAMTVADELGVFTRLADGPRTAAELARRHEDDEQGLRQLANLLCGLGLLQKSGTPAAYELTDLSRAYLLPESPAYRGATFFRARKSPEHQRLLQVFRGENAASLLKGNGKTMREMWTEGNVSPEAAKEFAPAMHAGGYAAAQAAAKSQAFDGLRRVLDVGGGSGSFGIALATRPNPPQVTLFDLPPVCEAARDYLQRFGADRVVTPYPGNFWKDAWPSGHDGILFSNVLHDWSIEQCRELAARAFAALPSGGKVLVHEMLLDDDECGPVTTLCFSLLMYVTHQAQQLTANQVADILAGAGFESITVTPTFAYYSVVSAVRP